MKFFSSMISLLILGSVCGGASYIVYKSAISETSNVRVIQTFIQKESHIEDAHAASIPTFPGSASLCDVSKIVVRTKSLVDFLEMYNLESSFQARSRLASEAHINDYHGFESQNQKLLDYLIDRLSQSCVYSG
jgi:hypothetical protein